VGYQRVLTSTQIYNQQQPEITVAEQRDTLQHGQPSNRDTLISGEMEQVLNAHPINGVYRQANSMAQQALQPANSTGGNTGGRWHTFQMGRPAPKRPHNLPVFSGEKSETTPIEWFRRWCDAVEAEGANFEFALQHWMQFSLTGRALLWHNFNVSQGVNKVSREAFKTELMRHFDPFYMRTLKNNWASCSQHQEEPITDFICRAAAYIKELCPEEDDKEKVRMVIRKVTFTYKWQLSRAGCQNLVQLMEYADRLQFELLEANNITLRQQPTVWAEPSLAPHTSKAAFIEMDEHKSRADTPPHTRLSRTKSPGLPSPTRRRCTNCGQFGHLSGDCRSKKEQEGSETQPKQLFTASKN
jgi:hypothetical protein